MKTSMIITAFGLASAAFAQQCGNCADLTGLGECSFVWRAAVAV
jgi:hypothetical protein